jgi:hypothetical protein
MDLPTFLIVIKTDTTPFLISFIAAVILAIFPGNLIIRRTYNYILHNTTTYDHDKTLLALAREFFDVKDGQEYRDSAGGLVGCLERSAYIFGIMFGQPGVITGVLILKAFFGWVEQLSARTSDRSQPLTIKAYIAVYYVYIIGNLLSLILALILAELGFLLFPHIISHLGIGITCHELCTSVKHIPPS